MESCIAESSSISILSQKMGVTGKEKICECGCGEIVKERWITLGSTNGEKRMFWEECQVTEEKKEEETRIQYEIEYKKARFESLMKKSRLGKRFLDSTFETFKITDLNKETFIKAKEYATNFKQHKTESMLLHSHPGTGKTFVTACIVNEIIKNNYTAIFVVVPDLLAQIRDTYSKKNRNERDEDTEEKIMDGLVECDLLVLDDIGAERHTSEDDWANEKLFSIINNRYLDYKPILFTSNLSPNELHKKLSPRTFSRICEMTNRDFVDMNNIKDIRIHGI